jgi:hypothetical protein
MMKNTNPVLDVLRDSWDAYDSWGSTLSAHFDIAECLYRYGAEIPDEWEFSPGMGIHVGDELPEGLYAFCRRYRPANASRALQ